MNQGELETIIKNVKIFDRTFEITPIEAKIDGVDRRAWLVRVCYDEADIDTGKIERQKARLWLIDDAATESDVVDTLFAAVMRSYDHVVQEHFMYKDRRVFSPHFTIDQRLSMSTLCPVCQGPHSDPLHHAVRQLERIGRTGTEQGLVEQVLATCEHWLRQDMFTQVDDLFRVIRWDLPPSVYLAALSITYPAKDRLKNRRDFVARVEEKLTHELGSDRAENLLAYRR